MNRTKIAALVAVVALLATAAALYSHCQIPCGIYGDPARIDRIAENITTVEKSMNEINRLSAEKKPNYNQLVRWVDNKDVHADDTMEIITAYFMAQRIKPVQHGAEGYHDYINKITLLHSMLVESMKTKQTTDLAHVENLRDLLAKFKTAYLGPEQQHNPQQGHNH